MRSPTVTLTLGIALLFALASPAAIVDEPKAILQQEDLQQRAAQLRAEAAAHQVMERQAMAVTGGSRRERRWRRTMIQLCRDYAASAIQTAEAYERAAPGASPPPTEPHGLMTHASPPVTAAEYAARAAEYEAQAEGFRADADRHLAMLRSSPAYDPQPPYDSRGSAQARRGGFFESPRDRDARERHRDIAQESLDLARAADNIARHYRVRARQLEAAR